jgi:hypothetical protein
MSSSEKGEAQTGLLRASAFCRREQQSRSEVSLSILSRLPVEHKRLSINNEQADRLSDPGRAVFLSRNDAVWRKVGLYHGSFAWVIRESVTMARTPQDGGMSGYMMSSNAYTPRRQRCKVLVRVWRLSGLTEDETANVSTGISDGVVEENNVGINTRAESTASDKEYDATKSTKIDIARPADFDSTTGTATTMSNSKSNDSTAKEADKGGSDADQTPMSDTYKQNDMYNGLINNNKPTYSTTALPNKLQARKGKSQSTNTLPALHATVTVAHALGMDTSMELVRESLASQSVDYETDTVAIAAVDVYASADESANMIYPSTLFPTLLHISVRMHKLLRASSRASPSLRVQMPLHGNRSQQAVLHSS